MDYKNEKLNIEITNNVFEIKEEESCVELYFDNNLKYGIFPNSTIELWDNSHVVAYNNSHVVACNNSHVEAYDNSHVEAYDNSHVEAYDNSIIQAYNVSNVVAHDFSTIYRNSSSAKIKSKNHFGAIIKQEFKVKKTTLVYKKLENGLIATLELSKGQTFQSEHHGKCRTNRALVVAIESIDKSISFKSGISHYDNNFMYEVGKEIIVNEYDENIEECSNGIHFFLNRKSAEEY